MYKNTQTSIAGITLSLVIGTALLVLFTIMVQAESPEESAQVVTPDPGSDSTETALRSYGGGGGSDAFLPAARGVSTPDARVRGPGAPPKGLGDYRSWRAEVERTGEGPYTSELDLRPTVSGAGQLVLP